ncbi:hypothetical protein JTB14_004498 [Gonioctena quinquepunctata]|nr:hypothetical protein JTB14_004498 [Gonioctena quinquepunctata]
MVELKWGKKKRSGARQKLQGALEKWRMVLKRSNRMPSVAKFLGSEIHLRGKSGKPPEALADMSRRGSEARREKREAKPKQPTHCAFFDTCL